MAKGRKTGGRQAGTPNKVTASAREAWEDAIAYAQGQKGMSLRDWATRDAESNGKFWQATMQMVPKTTTLNGAITLEGLLAQSHKAD